MAMKNDNPLEKVIEKTVCKYAESKGCIHYKFLSDNCRGVPDRIIITLAGDVLFVEFKRKGKKLTPLQKVHRDKIQNNMGMYYMVDSIEDGKYMVDTAC
jgi:hypothetical protein